MAMSRKMLEMVANTLNINIANYPNDSKLEQAVRYGLKRVTTTTTASHVAVTDAQKAAVSGDANV